MHDQQGFEKFGCMSNACYHSGCSNTCSIDMLSVLGPWLCMLGKTYRLFFGDLKSSLGDLKIHECMVMGSKNFSSKE